MQVDPTDRENGTVEKLRREERATFHREFAATRSHQDSAAANEHTKLLDQWLLGLNGIAATATLSFIPTATFDLLRLKAMIIIALILFAIGVASGAAAMRAHSKSLYAWLDYWAFLAGVGEPPTFDVHANDVIKAYAKASSRVKIHDHCYYICISSFVAGAILFSIGMLGKPSPRDGIYWLFGV